MISLQSKGLSSLFQHHSSKASILWHSDFFRKWQLPPVFLSGEFYGQRSLVGYSPWGSKESDMTEGLTLSHFFTFFFMVQLSQSNIHDYRKNHSLTRRIFVGKVVSLLLSTLSRFVHSFPSKEHAASNFMAGAVDRNLFSRNFPVPVLLCCPVSKCLDRGSCDYLSPSLESPSLQGHQLPPSSTLGKEGLGLGIFRNGK